MRNLTVICYIAGLVDGEAYIGLASRGIGRQKAPIIMIGMTDIAPLRLCAQTFGGAVRPKSMINLPKNYKPLWIWKQTGASAVATVAILRPYLLVKAEAADSIKDWRPTISGTFISLNGETRNVSEWARHLNIPLRTIQQRRANGWSDEDTLTVSTNVVGRKKSFRPTG